MDQSRRQIEAILGGDSREFASLVDEHKRLVSHIVFRMVPGDADREDVCQDIFLRVYQNLAGFKHESKLSTWIARIAYNTSLNFLEKKRVPLLEDLSAEGDTVDSCPGEFQRPDEWAEDRRRAVDICREIDRLPVQYGLIISLYHLQEMSYDEIGRILGMPDGTVKSYLFRARKLLRERLTSRFAEEQACA